jgi:hypothetical protein
LKTIKRNNMSLQEYLNQLEPQRMPTVVLTSKDYKIASTFKYGGVLRSRVYINTKNPLLAGTEYCLIGTRLYTTDSDGNPLNSSCFKINNN